jgi:hypothetical protein
MNFHAYYRLVAVPGEGREKREKREKREGGP